MSKDAMVYKNGESWSVRTTASERALKNFETQEEAIQYGKEIAKKNKSELRVKGTDGKVRLSHDYSEAVPAKKGK